MKARSDGFAEASAFSLGIESQEDCYMSGLKLPVRYLELTTRGACHLQKSGDGSVKT